MLSDMYKNVMQAQLTKGKETSLWDMHGRSFSHEEKNIKNVSVNRFGNFG